MTTDMERRELPTATEKLGFKGLPPVTGGRREEM
jgi:hypothetical protein